MVTGASVVEASTFKLRSLLLAAVGSVLFDVDLASTSKSTLPTAARSKVV